MKPFDGLRPLFALRMRAACFIDFNFYLFCIFAAFAFTAAVQCGTVSVWKMWCFMITAQTPCRWFFNHCLCCKMQEKHLIYTRRVAAKWTQNKLRSRWAICVFAIGKRVIWDNRRQQHSKPNPMGSLSHRAGTRSRPLYYSLLLKRINSIVRTGRDSPLKRLSVSNRLITVAKSSN